MPDPRKLEGGLVQPIPPEQLEPTVPELTGLDQLRQSLPEAMARGVSQGLIGSFEIGLESFALEMRQSRGMTIDFASRGRAAAVLDEDEFQQYIKDVMGSQFTNVRKSQLIRGAQALREGTGTPEIFDKILSLAPKEDNTVTRAQAAMRAFIKENLDIDPELQETLAVEVATAAGTGVAFVAMRFIPGIGQVSMGTFAALVGSGESIKRAVEAGASNEQQARAGLLGAMAGATNIIPIERLFKPFKRIKGFKGALYAIAQRMVSQGLLEGSQEAVEGFMQNAIARVHTSDQDLLEGIERQGLVGFLVGTLFGGVGAIPRSQAVTSEFIRKGLLGYPTATDLVNQQTGEFQSVPEIVGNIRIDKFDPADMQNLIKERIQVAGVLSSTALDESSITLTEPEFAEARRGGRDVEGALVPIELINKLAAEIGADPAKLGPVLEREFGQALNAEQIMALRITVAQAGNDFFDKGDIYRNNKTSENRAQAVLALQRFEAILETLSGAAAEAGRSVRIFREPVSGEERAKGIEQILKLVGTDKFDAAMDMFSSLETPGQIAELIETGRITKAGPMDMLVEAYINSLLSGPQTHAVNIISNTVTAIGSVFETATSGILGKTVYIGAKDKVYLRETSSRAYGMIAGFGDGMVALGKVIWDERRASELLKTEARFKRAIPSFKVGPFNLGGSTIRIPTRLLAAEDSFFKAIGYRMELQQLAKHEAIVRGLKGVEHRQFIRDFPKILKEMNKAEQLAIKAGVLNKKGQDKFIRAKLEEAGFPLSQEQLDRYQDVNLQAIEAAHYQTFTKQLGRTGQAGLNFLNSHPALKFIVPFARTPTNIVKFAGERTPFSLFSPRVRAELIGRNGFYASQRQQGKLIFGTSLMTWAGSLAAQGLLTGSGPEDPEEKASWYNTGEWQPNSVRFCKDCPWISLSRVEPLGIILFTAANFQQIASKLPETTADELAVAISVAITDNLVSKTWLTGPAALALAINDPNRYGKAFMERFVGSLVVPTGIAQITRVEDPVLREVNSIMDAIRRRLPWSSPNLEPNYRWDGEIISFQGSFGPDLVSPLYKTERPEQPDVVNRELVSLGTGIKKPTPEIEGVDLLELPGGARLYSQYIVMAGKPAKKTLEALITVMRNGPQGNIWDIQTNEEKEKRIRKVVDRFRDAAKTVIMFSNQELFAAITKKKIDRATAIRAGKQLWPDETVKAIFGSSPPKGEQ
jgi:hypothetical protein